MLLTTSKPDECFVAGDYGQIVDIAGLVAHINAHESAFKLDEFETELLLNLKRSDGISQPHVAAMSSARRDQPVLITYLVSTVRPAELWVIDGNHRLLRRHADGFELTTVIFVPPEVLIKFISAR